MLETQTGSSCLIVCVRGLGFAVCKDENQSATISYTQVGDQPYLRKEHNVSRKAGHTSQYPEAQLHSLGLRHGTDKAYRHGYTSAYEKYLGPSRTSFKVFMEIGVLDGASLRMWRDWLPAVQVVGVDLYDKSEHLHQDSERILLRSPINQTDENSMREIIEEWDPDVVLEDGCHREYCQQHTLSIVFPLLKSGGFYIIEDLHECVYKNQEVCVKPLTYTLLKSFQKPNWTAKGCVQNYLQIKESLGSMFFYKHPSCGKCCSSITAILRKK